MARLTGGTSHSNGSASMEVYNGINFNKVLFFTAFLFISILSIYPVVAQQENITENKIPYNVVRVIDGDTIVVNDGTKSLTIRLIGVDTPETVHPRKPVEVYGKEASQFTSNLLKGKTVYLEYEAGTSQQDKYRRTLAYVYRAPDGLFVNLEIIRQGYGHAYTQYPFKYMELFRSSEKEAREEEKGLWKGEGISIGDITPPIEQEIQQPISNKKTRETTVFITRTGKKYHRVGCRYLSKSIIPISLKDAKQRGYTPCSECHPLLK
jgi:micrococcal nuclease